MECKECGKVMIYHDYYGRMNFTAMHEKYGDIFKCEQCETIYHTCGNNGELYEGHPC